MVADSSCLIGLSRIEQLDLLRELFSEVYIPVAVYDEVVIMGRGEVGSNETESAVKLGWIFKKAVSDDIAINALIIHLPCHCLSQKSWHESAFLQSNTGNELLLAHIGPFFPECICIFIRQFSTISNPL